MFGFDKNYRTLPKKKPTRYTKRLGGCTPNIWELLTEFGILIVGSALLWAAMLE